MPRLRAGALAALVLAPISFFASAPSSACSVCLAGDPQFSTHGASAQEPGSFSLYLEARGFRKLSGALPHDEEEAGAHGEEEGHGDDEASSGGHARERSARGRRGLVPRHGGVEHGGGHGGGAEEGAEDADAEDGASHDSGGARERSRGQRLDLFASWTPLDRWTLTLDVPFAFNRITETEAGAQETSTLNGFGDVALASSVVLWRDRDVLPSTWLEGRLWLKTPTGRDETEVDGRRDPHLQPGTGSWDFGAGLAAAHRRSWGSLYASAFYRENTPGSLDYTYGDVLLANLAVEVPVGHALGRPVLDWLTVGLELNFRYAGYDQQDGERYEDSGGSILYAAPSVRVRLPFSVGERTPSLRAAVQIPLTQDWLHGFQREKEVWSVGLLMPF